jgi:hypothetical protein
MLVVCAGVALVALIIGLGLGYLGGVVDGRAEMDIAMRHQAEAAAREASGPSSPSHLISGLWTPTPALLRYYRGVHAEFATASDAQVADALYNDYYAGQMTRAEFNDKVGIRAP